MKPIYAHMLAATLLSWSCVSLAQSSSPDTTSAPTEAQMQELQQQMDAMATQMQQMRNARTPEERQAAMQAHMATMQAHMQSMQEIGCCAGMTGGHMHGGMMDGDCMHRNPQQ